MTARAKRLVLGILAVLLAAAAAGWSYRYSRTKAHFQAAHAALERDDPESARSQVAECLGWWRNRFEIRFLAARAARLAGFLDEAEEHLAFCEKEFRGRPELRKERALLQIQQGDLADHFELIAPQGLNDPTLAAESLEALARGFLATYLDASAIQCLALLLQKAPTHGRGHLLAGEMATKLRRTEEANEHFKKAVEHSPNSLLPRLRLAENFMELGELREASPHLALLRSRFSENADVADAQARLFIYRGQRDDAKRLLDEILAKAPSRYFTWIERGGLELRNGDAQQAAAFFHRAVQVRPNALEGRRGLVEAYELLDRPDEMARARSELDHISRLLGEVANLEANIKPHDIRQTIELANRCTRLGLATRALVWHMRTLQLDPTHGPTHAALADYFESESQPHLAARHRTQARQ